MKIGDLAKRVGCQTVTVRYYEKEGLLVKPERTHNNYRMYDKKDMERLAFILHCRKHGIGLNDIRILLVFRDNPTGDCAPIGRMLDAHMQNIEKQIASLLQLKEGLFHLRGKCSGGHTGKECTIIQKLEDKGQCCSE